MSRRIPSSLRIAGVLVPLLAANLASAASKTAGGTVDTISTVVIPQPRASWLSDRRAIKPGDLLTVVVDERTQATEKVSQTATSNRALNAQMNAGLSVDARLGPNKAFGTTLGNNSQDQGVANRQGDLSAVMTVTVLSVDAAGIAKVHGTRHVSVDGREQVIDLTGRVRGADVEFGNMVLSSRVSEAVVTFNGKKIGPKMGIVGKFLAMLWP